VLFVANNSEGYVKMQGERYQIIYERENAHPDKGGHYFI